MLSVNISGQVYQYEPIWRWTERQGLHHCVPYQYQYRQLRLQPSLSTLDAISSSGVFAWCDWTGTCLIFCLSALFSPQFLPLNPLHHESYRNNCHQNLHLTTYCSFSWLVTLVSQTFFNAVNTFLAIHPDVVCQVFEVILRRARDWVSSLEGPFFATHSNWAIVQPARQHEPFFPEMGLSNLVRISIQDSYRVRSQDMEEWNDVLANYVT